MKPIVMDDMKGDERDVRRKFEEARRDQEPLVPAFSKMWAGARSAVESDGQPVAAASAASREPVFGRAGLAGATGILVLVVAIAVAGRGSDRTAGADAQEASLTEWTAPTDFLLAIPGDEYLSDLPLFGQADTIAAIVPRASMPTPEQTIPSPEGAEDGTTLNLVIPMDHMDQSRKENC